MNLTDATAVAAAINETLLDFLCHDPADIQLFLDALNDEVQGVFFEFDHRAEEVLCFPDF